MSTTQAPAPTDADAASPVVEVPQAEQAKSRLDKAIDEAKAGSAAMSDKARATGEEWIAEAKTKATDLAVEGKAKASEALSGLSRIVDDNAALIDEKLGPKYGDYARTASRTLQSSATTLNEKSLEELGENTKEAIRKSPAAAVGIAALVGFLLARMFRR